MDAPKFRIDLTIPEVVLRHSSESKPHFVYLIRVKVLPLTNEVQQSLEMETVGDNSVDWTVGLRYSMLAKLHHDLIGQDGGSTATVSEAVTTDSPRYAHECLPRPLPGLNQLYFPQKHRIPTVPGLVACRFSLCGAPVYDDGEVTDISVSKVNSSRLQKRRAELETYLRNLVTLVRQTLTLSNVANVYFAMRQERMGNSDELRCKRCSANPQVNWKCSVCEAARNLTSMLPILNTTISHRPTAFGR